MQHPRRLTGRLIPLTAAGALAGGLLVAPPAAADAHTVDIDIVGINDFHGRIEAGSRGVAGAAVLAGAVDHFRTQNANTLFVSAGDNIGASTFTSFVADDQPTLDVLNAMDLDVSALGNHEFDRGRADLDDRVIPAAEFPYLAANIYDRDTGERAYDPYWIADVAGVSVGFIGANTEQLPSLVSPAGIASLEVRPIVDEVNAVAADLTDGLPENGEADVLVLLVHEGPSSSSVEAMTDAATFGQIITGLSDDVQAVFSGHTHRQFAHLVPVDGWAAGLARPVVQGGQYGEAIARVTLTVEAATGELVGSAAEVVPLAGDPRFVPDPEVAEIVADAVEVAKELGSVPLGEITEDFLRPTQPVADEPGEFEDNRGGESTLGNLVADVQLWATQDLGEDVAPSEIAFMNPGGLRTDLLYAASGEEGDGVVTYAEAANVQPFANTLVTMTLTGEQVIAVLEEQWQPEGASRPFLKLGVAGLTYTYDPAAPAGERITEVWVGEAPLDPTAGYRVTANSFLASGGDNFFTLADGTDVADSGRVDLQAFVDYMAAFSPVSPDLAQRAVGIHLVDAPEAGYAPGDEVTVDLSSLLFAAADGQATEVVLTVGGETVATAELDAEQVFETDETGRATVTFRVPETGSPVLPGATLEVEVTVPGNGTATSFTLPLAATSAYLEDVRAQARTFAATVVVTNTTDVPACGWELVAELDAGDRVLTGKQVAKVEQDGTTVTFTPKGRFADLEPGESVRIPVQGQHDGALEPLEVTSFTPSSCG